MRTEALKVLFDITRLAWSVHRPSPSGIDRVAAAYGRWLDQNEDFEVLPVSYAGGRLSPAPRERFRRLLARAGPPTSESTATWDALKQALQAGPATRRAARRPAATNDRRALTAAYHELAAHWRDGLLQPRPTGDVYLNVSHVGMQRPGLLAGLAARGIAPVIMVHDLIPITHPEYCTSESHRLHAARIEAILSDARLVIANSAATAEALQTFARQKGAPTPHIAAAPLGLEPAFLAPPGAPLVAGPYFVCVGTIEARKNLAFLLAVWRRLVETLGDASPQLVLVGQRGWENEAVIDHLERSAIIRPYVHEVSGLHDTHLAQLMSGAQALLAPSLAEGFDLPLMEALSLGVPAIGSDIPVHRELAGAARLRDPLDGPAWLEAIMAVLARRPTTKPAAGPLWAAHFQIVGRELAALGRAREQ